MLLNGVLFNSEAWHGVTNADMKSLESIDEQLLRSLVQAHSKTPIEFLYLESGAIPIRFLISSRRMVYLRTILSKDDSELVKRIYRAQANNPSLGDYVELIKSDFQTIAVPFEEAEIINQSAPLYKSYIKTKVREAALKYLNTLKDTHSKIKHIEYESLQRQVYLTSPLFSNTDVNILFSLRSRMVECKSNFKNNYRDNNLLCPFCSEEDDSQQHMLERKILGENLKTNSIARKKIVYGDLFKNVEKQKGVTQLFKEIIEIRKELEEDLQCNLVDPSTSVGVLRNSSDLLNCIDDYSSGK